MKQKIRELIEKYKKTLNELQWEREHSLEESTAWALFEGEFQRLRRVIRDLERLL